MVTIENFAELVPKELLNESGSVFYSGRAAFSGHKALYILGLNPGGRSGKANDQNRGPARVQGLERETRQVV